MSDETPAGPGGEGGGEPPKPKKKAPRQWVPPGGVPPPAAAPPGPAAPTEPPAPPPSGEAKPKKAPRQWQPPGTAAPSPVSQQAAAPPAAAAAPRADPAPAGPAWEREPEAPVWREAEEDPVVTRLRSALGTAILSARSFAGDLVLEVGRPAWRDTAAALRAEGYELLIDVTAADFPGRDGGRFDVVAIACSLAAQRRVRLKTRVAEGEEVPSLTPVWRGANWPEREVYDMYGVRFADHPDPTRILLWEGFNGHPLRKDFPVEGVDTGSAIYPEYYQETAGPVAGTGTGWRPKSEEQG